MRPTTASRDNIVDLNSFLHRGLAFGHPLDVVSDPNLTLAEKRAILASSASDASAIASCPSLRAPEGLKAPVTIDEILEANAPWTKAPGTRPAAGPCGSDRSNVPRPRRWTVENRPASRPDR